MSPFLKAVAVGAIVFVTTIFLMWGISRLMNRPFLPRFPRAPVTSATPTPVPPLFPTR